MIKKCVVCGEEFEARNRRQIFCSEECRAIQNIHKERSGMIITPGTKVLFNKTRLEIEYRKDKRFDSNDEFMKFLLDNVGYSLR